MAGGGRAYSGPDQKTSPGFSGSFVYGQNYVIEVSFGINIFGNFGGQGYNRGTFWSGNTGTNNPKGMTYDAIMGPQDSLYYSHDLSYISAQKYELDFSITGNLQSKITALEIQLQADIALVKGLREYVINNPKDYPKNLQYAKWAIPVFDIRIGQFKRLLEHLYEDETLDDWQVGLIGPRCFPAGTLISLLDGTTLPIETIAAELDVASFADPSRLGPSGLAPLQAGRVVRTFTNVATEFIELVWTDPSRRPLDGVAPQDEGGGVLRTLTATPGHVMLTPEGRYKQLGEMVASGRKTEDGRRKGEIAEAPRNAALPCASPSGLSRGSSLVSSTKRLDARDEHDERGAPLTKGQRFGAPIGTVELVDETGAIVLAQAYLLQYSAATADPFEQAGMLVAAPSTSSGEGGLARKPERRMAA